MTRKYQSALYRAGALILMAIGVNVPVMADPEVQVAPERPFPVEHAMFGMGVPREGDFGHFGQVGVTGLELRFHPGRLLKVEKTLPGTPAADKFKTGDVIVGINGIVLEGTNPFIVLGASLTRAEAGDGRLVFDVLDAASQARQVTLQIPVLDAYSDTWPMNCKKSEGIVARAAEFYANRRKYADGGANDELTPANLKSHGIGGALATLFLLSTGDDQYLPRVKEYVDHLAADIKGIGNHTWNNGYNGIVCAEYYLRTGDKSVLPVLQYYCNDARDRQYYGVGWGHWGRSINPRYVGGGLMNAAGTQMLTTLLLGKECGVQVDDATLVGALRQGYRFAGRGAVPYGDHRGEGGLGSNGKDGMTAAMMQAASGAQGNVEIYRQARDYLSMSTLTSYPGLARGHGDEGRGDGIWRGIGSAYHLDVNPEEYHAVMNRLQWWFDLSRRHAGGIGMSMAKRFDDVGSGAGLALAYTAPRKTLRITGAPRSEHARSFTLPEHLWGREADRAFQSVDHGEPFSRLGEDEPVHIPLGRLGSAYAEPAIDLNTLPRNEILKNVHHKRFMIRTQAAKALFRIGALDELERLLEDQDPRVRRAGLDGLTDYRYWFHFGKNPAKSEQITPAILASVRKMLADPEEALFVVDGALMVLSRAPAEDILASLPLVLPWTTHDEWWLRQSAFAALTAIARDDAQLPRVLPTMLEMLNREGRAQARGGMQGQITAILKRHPTDSPLGKQVIDGLMQAIHETPIRPEPRSGEGRYYVVQSTLAALQGAQADAASIAEGFQTRFAQLNPKDMETVTQRLIEVCGKLPEPQQAALTARLYGDYRNAFIRLLHADENSVSLDTILALTQLRHPDRGWQILGRQDPAERIWRFTSFAPQPEDELPPYIGKRFRDVALAETLQNWFTPDYDAKAWETGKAPMGKGIFKGRGRQDVAIENRSTWGDGEFIVMRCTFEMDPKEYDYFRLRILANQGFRVYLNGHEIHTYIWWNNSPEYRAIRLDSDKARFFQKGTNHLAIYANAAYKDGQQIAQIDAYFEGLKKKELIGTAD